MKKIYTWFERYQIALKENLSVKEIMILRNVGQPTALQLRREAINYCLKNDIEIISNKAPTEVIMRLTGKALEFYYEKMVLELEAIELHNRILNK